MGLDSHVVICSRIQFNQTERIKKEREREREWEREKATKKTITAKTPEYLPVMLNAAGHSKQPMNENEIGNRNNVNETQEFHQSNASL